MGLYHVAVSGRDRRHLSALGVKLRVVVVGYRESERGIGRRCVCAEKKIAWLEKQGYTVNASKKSTDPRCRRQAEGATRWTSA